MSYHLIPKFDRPKEDFLVSEYSIDKLIDIFSSYSDTDRNEVLKKQHINYFKNYFEKREARKMVIEYRYVDKDYLEDYSAYYARSYKDYPRQTIRVHFFKTNDISKEYFQKIIENKDLEKATNLNNDYLGYIVVRPIPRTMIGKTVLITYPENVTQRSYPIARTYKAHLFGITFDLQSIGYQEQDKSVAACATSALWCMFQSTGYLFQHAIPSPAEITNLATKNSYYVDRVFPSKGLSLEQISNCIKALKLEPQNHYINGYQFLKAVANAYLNARIPVLLCTSQYSITQQKFLGEHAVAIMGFSKGETSTSNFYGIGNKEKRLYLSSSRIDKIFVHDDQVGPFARMNFDDPMSRTIKVPNGEKGPTHYSSLSTSWRWGSEEEEGKIRSVPNTLLVPLYHKIRIPFEQVFTIVSFMNMWINELLEDKTQLLIEEWDILLEQGQDFKERFFAEPSASQEERFRVLTSSLPRFLWRAKAIKAGEVVFEILLDATDIIEGHQYQDTVIYDNEFCKGMYEYFLKDSIDTSLITDKHAKYCFGKLLDRLSKI